MLTLLEDSDQFDTEAIRAAEDIHTVLTNVARKYEAQRWHAALVLYVASEIRQDRLEQGMPDTTADMLCKVIR